jgi:hypothetical protein
VSLFDPLGLANGAVLPNRLAKAANQIAVRFGQAEPGEAGDRLTLQTVRRIQADNRCFAGEARWRERAIMRLSVSSMATTSDEAERACEAILAAWRAVRES